MIKVNKVMVVFKKEHDLLLLKFMFSKKAIKTDENLYLTFGIYNITSDLRWIFRQFFRPS